MIALDIETTGLFEDKHSMVSLGAVHIETRTAFYGTCRKYDESLVSDIAMEINGFTREEINNSNKILPHQLYKRFASWCIDEIGNMPFEGGDELLIGQNLPSFDLKFLKYYHFGNFINNSFKWPFGHRYGDLHSYVLAKTDKSMSADETSEYLGLPPEPRPHNALNGAIQVAEIYLKLSSKN